jgi:hypothetical protein
MTPEQRKQFEEAAEKSADQFYYPEGELRPHYKRGFLAGCEHALPKWIDVEERTPEDGQQILVHGKGGRHVTAIWKEHDPLGSFLAYSYFTEELEEAEEITHWMPLPSPPSIQEPLKS